MVSLTRQDCTNAVNKFSKNITCNNHTNTLYVGIAGDPPGGEYKNCFKGNVITFDADPKWNPQIIGDITKTDFKDNCWDNIIIVQVIEHIPNIFDLPKELYRILRPNGNLIIDCPWNYPYHPEPPSFGDYWRITKDAFRYLFMSFKEVEIISTEHNTSCHFRK